MAGLTYQLFSIAVVLGAVQPIGGYSFKNCIGDSYSKNFNCINRKEMNTSAIIKDLPPTAINLTISYTLIVHIPKESFVHLPNLRNLRLDHNHLSNIDDDAFRGLNELKSLNVSFNNIRELSPSVFDNLNNLNFLSLTNNSLKQLPRDIFSNLSHLDTLVLGQNFLTNFSGIAESVSHLQNLSVLDLCSNNLTSLSHSNASLPKSLTTLFLCKNKLVKLGCKNRFLGFIQVLDLSQNLHLDSTAFEEVDLSHINDLRLRSTSVDVLTFLNISNVNARHVDFSGTHLNNTRLTKLCRLLRKKGKTIRKLSLGYNQIHNLTNQMLEYCPTITGNLDLTHNNLNSTSCLEFINKQKSISSINVEHNHLTILHSCQFYSNNVTEVSYRYNRILTVFAYAFNSTPNVKTLELNINIIAYLDCDALSGLTSLETLRLDNNILTDLLQCMFRDNHNLKILNLRNNRIAVIFKWTFFNLSSLTTLDLGGNKITHFEESGLDGLKSLSKFYLDGNNLKQIDTSFYHVFQDTLTTLDLQRNQIRFLNEETSSPFRNLSKLSDLKLDGQRPYGLTVLPRHFFRGLHSLRSLYLTHNDIFFLEPDAFDDLTGLQFLTLDNCCVGATQLQPGVFKNMRNLTLLVLENMGIQNFSKDVFGNLTQLSRLQLNRNVMQIVDVGALESLPNLNYLDIRNTPLICTCDNSLLQNWTVYSNVQVVYLYNLLCPHDPKQRFYNFDTKVCYQDVEMYLFISTAVAIFLFTATPLLYIKLYWKMKYGYYMFRSWFSEQWRILREQEENCKYDAFVSYNSADEQWVMEQLMANLEGNGSSLKLCLHHRDFELGRDIVDNIVSAVYSSRKTICVVSRNFLKSEWCSLEIQLASYRLFDEHRDVLLLVFLEEISQRQVSSYHRMRKVMLKKTYLQWPGSDCTNPTQAQELFWNKLRRAMRSGSNPETEEQHSEGCKEENRETETHTSDEKYYLLP
uniref:TIR domain-containing protein n=1 Tax=Gasterosteus aculeatus aculeatus TaxID=481459 RepID=A0AAQ4S796_GASAC|nr:toll-like receptor 21 [Gasterosteus aculeatus aculeatus]XP_040020516.1 toll-like receptor 21 [Gasterosteus aculeatus aculeatus]XP_040020517.1 toll-like receptor 21 [Gasterosteus aculeatus aculeatus]